MNLKQNKQNAISIYTMAYAGNPQKIIALCV